MSGRFFLAAAVLLAWPASSLTAADARDFQSTPKPFLQKYCFTCHGEKKQKSRIRFDRLSTYRAEDSQLLNTPEAYEEAKRRYGA